METKRNRRQPDARWPVVGRLSPQARRVLCDRTNPPTAVTPQCPRGTRELGRVALLTTRPA